jgi:hypothetical protein
VVIGLFAFSIYTSILYFGNTIIPNSDFPAFFRTGQDVLSLQIPYSFKRVPMLGILQVLLSYLVGGQYPGLTAGWLLNAILHPFNLILLWLVGKKIVGRSALWLAVIAIINPQVLYLLTEPIAETTLLFFILLTTFFIFRRSKWSYLFASITTMVRYEGAALILAAFVMDMIHAKDRRERVFAFVYSLLASLPLAIWMVGTLVYWEADTGHYLSLFGEKYSKLYVESAESRTGVVKHMSVLWQTGFRPLLMPHPSGGEAMREFVVKLSQSAAMVSFFFGAAYGLFKRKWNVLALLIFFLPYFAIHVKFPSPLQRYHMPIFWIALLLSWFGLQSAWILIDKNGRIFIALKLSMQAILAVVATIWFFGLVPYLSGLSKFNPASGSVPWAAICLVAVLFLGRIYIYRSRFVLRELSIMTLMCLVIVSNQFSLVQAMSYWQKNMEFKQLAQWYISETKPGEKLGVYMSGVVRIFAQDRASEIVRPPKADDPRAFVEACYDQDIKYIVWATREGLSTDHTGYRQSKLDRNIAMLRQGRDQGPYKFVTRIGSEQHYVHVFRLIKPEELFRSPRSKR